MSDTQMVEFKCSIIDDRFGAFRRGQRTELPKAIAWRWEAAGGVRLVETDTSSVSVAQPMPSVDMNDVMRQLHGGVMNTTIVRGPEPQFSLHAQGMTRPSHCDCKAPPFPGYRNG